MTVNIPAWNSKGLIPPIGSGESNLRSPYIASLEEFVLRFSLSSQRCKIIKGFLDYRSRLHAAGLVNGFMWVNGSFLENIELIEKRSPNDIDFVIFYRPPLGKTEQQIIEENPDIFAFSKHMKKVLKEKYFVDPYFVNLENSSEKILERGTYWYSMWSHRRNEAWKGYIQIELDSSSDEAAYKIILQSEHMVEQVS